MNSFEEANQVFIVRIWRESREIAGAAPQWRGVIEHVPTGSRQFFDNLKELMSVFREYLIAMGVDPDSPGQEKVN